MVGGDGARAASSESVDVVIVGSGIAGLCCGALLAKYGYSVVVCESHSIPGGAAHSFQRDGYRFDSGPSLYSGLSYSPSPNPLRQVLDAIGEDVEWANYERWGCCLPEGTFDTTVGGDQFCDVLERLRGSTAVEEWRELQRLMQPLAEAANAVPPTAMRFDWRAFRTVGRFAPNIVKQAGNVLKLTGPFSRIMDEAVSDEFARNWLDLLCFLLSGLPADGTIGAEVAFMFAEWYRSGVTLDYPIGGSGALVDALVRGLENHGGELRLGTHVDRIVVEGTRATGVLLRNGKTLRANRAVVSNASVWDTLKLVPKIPVLERFRRRRVDTPECGSFMHLHLGIDAANLPEDLACHYIVVKDWSLGIDAPQNVVLISIPSLLDPTLAPAGKHAIHVYTPGNEPYQLWHGLDRRSQEYARLKHQRSAVMWSALERVIPDIRSRTELELVGTPLTHSRFLRRHHGTYGPALRAGKAVFPGPNTPLKGLYCCGDSTFPGIGLPAVAASGAIAAHTIAPVAKQLAMLKEISVLS